jgi:signal peptidase I
VETANIRKVNPILALVAGFFCLGMGYVYIGRLRLAVTVIVAFYGALTFFALTRLVVYSAEMWWLICVIFLLVFGISLIHPIALAIKHRALPRKRYNRWWFYVIWIIGYNGLAYIVTAHRASLLGYEPFRIPSLSMSPSVEQGDFVLADTWRFRKHAAVAGEIVIVEIPQTPNVKYIKRVAAVAGDIIETRSGTLYRNGEAVAEPYVHAPIPFGGSPRNVPMSVLGPGMIYVLGDYRDNSLDSRQWGPLLTASLRGRVQYIWLSIEDRKIRWDRIGMSLVPHN